MLACSAASEGAGGCCSGSGGGVGIGGVGIGAGAGGLGCAGWAFGLGVGGGGARRGDLFANRLTVVVSDHHDDEFGLLGRDDLARHLRPLEIAALFVANEAGIGAMLAHDADLRVLGKSVFEPVGQPIGVGIAHHYDRGRGLGLLLRRRRRARIVDRRLPFLPLVVIAPIIPTAAEPVVVPVIVVLLLTLRTAAPISPELCLRRQQQREADACDRRGNNSSKH